MVILIEFSDSEYLRFQTVEFSELSAAVIVKPSLVAACAFPKLAIRLITIKIAKIILAFPKTRFIDFIFLIVIYLLSIYNCVANLSTF
jgi:hypothetical protein